MKSDRVFPVIRIYLAILVASAVPFGLAAGLCAWNVRAGLINGAIFGVAFTAIVASLAVAGHRGRSGPISPRQRITFRLDTDVDLVRWRAGQALGAVSPGPVDMDDRGRLVVRTPLSTRSCGEIVSVEMSAEGSVTDVVISSRPVVPITLADYGKGRDNVEAVERLLRV